MVKKKKKTTKKKKPKVEVSESDSESEDESESTEHSDSHGVHDAKIMIFNFGVGPGVVSANCHPEIWQKNDLHMCGSALARLGFGIPGPRLGAEILNLARFSLNLARFFFNLARFQGLFTIPFL